MRTKPPKFENAQQFIDLWTEFCNEIESNGYEKVPTQTQFCRWLSERFEDTDRRTIYNYLNRYFPSVKGEFERIQADTIATGAMLGKYQSTMSIFGLKNWCGWTDKLETKNESVVNVREASEKLAGIFEELKNDSE